MCFSAGASFIASGVLASSSAAALTKVKLKREIPLALFPLLFGVQQFIEGIQWQSDKPSELSLIMGYIYLAFAFILWPVYTPFSILLVEPKPARKKILRFLLLLGFGVAIFLGITLLREPLAIAVIQNHIEYIIGLPWTWGLVPYGLAICGSCLISSHRLIQWLGVGALLGLGVSLILYYTTFGSVWCFFAAALSVLIYFHFRGLPKLGKSGML